MADAPVLQFDPQSGLAQNQSGGGASVPRLGVTGGNIKLDRPMSFDGPGQGMPSAILPSFLQDAFAPQMEKAKQQAMWDGFVAARNGKSAQEIHDEQPWYSKIFGPTNFEMGAEMYGVQKAANDVSAQFTQGMSEYRKLTPEQLGSALNDLAAKAMTGDSFTDALIQKSLMQQAGPMLNAHAKARYAWQQETLAQAQNSAWLSGSTAYNASQIAAATLGQEHPGQAPTPEQQAEAKQAFLQQFQSPATQDPTSYFNNVMNTVDQMAQQGHWYSIKALQDSGLLERLPVDQQDRIGSKIDTERSKFKKRLAAGPLMKPIAQVFTQARAGAISAENAVGALMHINDQYHALTGDDSDLFDQGDAIRIAESAGGAYFSMWERMANKADAAQAKAQTQAEKDQAAARNEAQIALAVGTHSAGTVAGLKNVNRDDVERAMDSSIAANPANAADVVVGNFAAQQPFVSDRLKQRLQSTVTLAAGEQWTNGFQTAYDQWKQMRYHVLDTGTGSDSTSGQAAAMVYYGNLNKPMQQYDDQLQLGVPKELAYRRAFGNEASFGSGHVNASDWDTTQRADDKAKAELQSAVADLNPSWWQLTQKNMGTSAQALVTQASSRYYQELRKNNPELSVKDATAQAVKMAQLNGLEIAGRFAWQNSKSQSPVSTEAGLSPDVFNKLFDESMSNRFKAQGLSMGKDTSVTIFRLGDDTDGPRLVATAYDRDSGTNKSIAITGKELKALRDKHAADQMKRYQQQEAERNARISTNWNQNYRPDAG